MREDPLPDMDPNEKFYAGDNQNRVSGQALELKQLNIHAWEAFVKGNVVHMQAAPSQAELLYKNFKVNKEKLKSEIKETIMEKYGNAATEEPLPKELLQGQSEREVEYDCTGRIIKGQDGSGQCSCSGKMVKGKHVKPIKGDAVLFCIMVCFLHILLN